jgi:hypothetical protein
MERYIRLLAPFTLALLVASSWLVPVLAASPQTFFQPQDDPPFLRALLLDLSFLWLICGTVIFVLTCLLLVILFVTPGRGRTR